MKKIFSIYNVSVGKQRPCILSFVYTSYDRSRVRTVLKFGNRVLLFSYIRKMFYTYPIICGIL